MSTRPAPILRRPPEGGEAERGSAPVEFVMVGGLLTVLTLAVIQLGIAVYVRNVVHDAAVEGAHHAALADTDPAEGAARARLVIERAVGASYADDIRVGRTEVAGAPAIEVSIRATLPLFGLLGAPRAMEVSARAPAESLP